MDLKNKKILITAGPTWVAIDKVRVISNTASGTTGILLAKTLSSLGAKVTLVLGQSAVCCLPQDINIINFRFFEELEDILKSELRANKFDIIIHSSAVSDFRPAKRFNGKISSDRKTLDIHLVRTPKLIDSIKRSAAGAKIIAFKYVPDCKKNRLLKLAEGLKSRLVLEAVVANTDRSGRYEAYILQNNKVSSMIKDKIGLTKQLIKNMRGS